MSAQVAARVTGARLLEGAAVVSLKPSVVEGDAKRLQALTLGGLATGHVSSVQDFGLVVDLSKTLR